MRGGGPRLVDDDGFSTVVRPYNRTVESYECFDSVLGDYIDPRGSNGVGFSAGLYCLTASLAFCMIFEILCWIDLDLV